MNQTPPPLNASDEPNTTNQAEVLHSPRTSLALSSNARFVLPTPELPDSLAMSRQLLEDLTAAGRLAERALAESTANIYRTNLRYWERYCERCGMAAYPPNTAAVMAWLASMATISANPNDAERQGPLAFRTITQRLAALNKLCEVSGWQRPGDDPRIAELVAGIRRTLGIAPQRELAPFDVQVMRVVLDHTYLPTIGQLRDRALAVLLVHQQAKRGCLGRVTWDDVTFTDHAVRIAQPPAASRPPRPGHHPQLCRHRDGELSTSGTARPLQPYRRHQCAMATRPDQPPTER